MYRISPDHTPTRIGVSDTEDEFGGIGDIEVSNIVVVAFGNNFATAYI